MLYKNSYLDVEPSQWESLFKTHLLYSSAEFLLLSGNVWSSRPWPHIVDPLYLSMPPEVKWAIVPAILKSSSFSKSKKLCLALCISPLQFLRKLILCNVVSIFFWHCDYRCVIQRTFVSIHASAMTKLCIYRSWYSCACICVGCEVFYCYR